MPEKTAYKRLETDGEFLERIRAKQGTWVWMFQAPRGDMLDESAWMAFQMQRKIVEVFP